MKHALRSLFAFWLVVSLSAIAGYLSAPKPAPAQIVSQKTAPGGASGDVQFDCADVFGNAACVDTGWTFNLSSNVLVLTYPTATGLIEEHSVAGGNAIDLGSTSSAVTNGITMAAFDSSASSIIEYSKSAGGAGIFFDSLQIGGTDNRGGAFFGGVAGILTLGGSTSGKATLTAPAVADTSTNPITVSNTLFLPSGSEANPSYAFGSAGSAQGFWLNGTAIQFQNGLGNSMNLDSSGSLGVTGNIQAGSASAFFWGGSDSLRDSDGVISANTTFNATGYQAGGTPGVTAGPFSAIITSIQTVGGIVTALESSLDLTFTFGTPSVLEIGNPGANQGAVCVAGSSNGSACLTAPPSANSRGNPLLSTNAISLPAVYIVGTRFTTNGGCSETTLTGGSTAGSVVSGTTGTCTFIVTMGSNASSANGWTGGPQDQTTPADAMHITASTPTTATISGTTVTGDVISFALTGY